jgi:predicted acylesterase/phospholipase RssA
LSVSRHTKLEPHVVIFGGGGTRGLLHAGFARALGEVGIPIASYTGISIGSWAAGFLGMGLPIDELIDACSRIDAAHVLNLRSFLSTLWKHGSGYRGFFDPAFVQRAVEGVIGKARLRDTKVPIYIQSTDLATGEPFIFSRETTPDAPIALAVSASCSLVGVFQPVSYQGRTLVDGTYCGYMTPERRPCIISNVSPLRESENLSRKSILTLLMRSYSLLPQLLIDEVRRKNQNVVEIQHDCRGIGILTFNLSERRRRELMNRSYQQTLEILEQHANRQLMPSISVAA